LAEFKELITIRKSHDALINGGIRWIYASDNAFAYLRESKKESILVFIARSAGSHTLDLAPLGYRFKETLYGQAAKDQKIRITSKGATSGIWVIH
jgi:alpha-glucosidase